MTGRLRHKESGRLVAVAARRADRFFARFLGWMGRTVPDGVALGITDCRQVHTALVRTPLDLAFCDRDGCVLAIETLSPGRISRRVMEAVIVWEMRAGSLCPAIVPGDTLIYEE
jgi:uncharacterized membrane protein (UPF0127 family)